MGSEQSQPAITDSLPTTPIHPFDNNLPGNSLKNIIFNNLGADKLIKDKLNGLFSLQSL